MKPTCCFLVLIFTIPVLLAQNEEITQDSILLNTPYLYDDYESFLYLQDLLNAPHSATEDIRDSTIFNIPWLYSAYGAEDLPPVPTKFIARLKIRNTVSSLQPTFGMQGKISFASRIFGTQVVFSRVNSASYKPLFPLYSFYFRTGKFKLIFGDLRVTTASGLAFGSFSSSVNPLMPHKIPEQENFAFPNSYNTSRILKGLSLQRESDIFQSKILVGISHLVRQNATAERAEHEKLILLQDTIGFEQSRITKLLCFIGILTTEFEHFKAGVAFAVAGTGLKINNNDGRIFTPVSLSVSYHDTNAVLNSELALSSRVAAYTFGFNKITPSFRYSGSITIVSNGYFSPFGGAHVERFAGYLGGKDARALLQTEYGKVFLKFSVNYLERKTLKNNALQYVTLSTISSYPVNTSVLGVGMQFQKEADDQITRYYSVNPLLTLHSSFRKNISLISRIDFRLRKSTSSKQGYRVTQLLRFTPSNNSAVLCYYGFYQSGESTLSSLIINEDSDVLPIGVGNYSGWFITVSGKYQIAKAIIGSIYAKHEFRSEGSATTNFYTGISYTP